MAIRTGRLTRTERYKRRIKILPKYFLHGIFYSVIMSALSFLWGPFLAPLTQMPALLVLIVLGAAIFFMMGTVNAGLTISVWKLKMQFGLWTDFKHGLILFLVLFFVYFGLLIGLSFIWIFIGIPVNISVTILVIIISAFVNGYVGRAVAGIWEEY